ncbi:hypothetical protein E2C01_082409 [Portunus trituberculatus]|uniref:Uncharacterized protein n=1 Tax=Portunus trituberculatus TaxID=210409 RepID=A0A5B7J4V8_PORTR|nr:hypothetical protein [Portunus trituberculatus]
MDHSVREKGGAPWHDLGGSSVETETHKTELLMIVIKDDIYHDDDDDDDDNGGDDDKNKVNN